MNSPLPKLFQPISIRSVTARNRIVVSPMCQYKSVKGAPNAWHLVNFGRYAIGGAGIVFTEETAVEERGRKTHSCAGIYLDEHIPAYRAITDFIKSLGAVPAMQLGHCGSRGSERGPLEGRAALSGQDADSEFASWQTISSSAVPSKAGGSQPREMTKEDIAEVIDAFVKSTRRALEAGYEMLEIHGAHGYLIHQFLSPLINRRTDEYGGDLKSRIRFGLEIAEAVRAAWPDDKPLFFRVSSVDGKGGLWSLADTVAFAAELKHCGVDVIDCSSGGLTGSSTMPLVPRIPGYHLPYARRVKAETGMMTMAPGMITEPEQAESILQEGATDLIGMARELMYCADWPVHAAEKLGVPDFLKMFPPEFTQRLEDRAAQRLMPANVVGAVVPTGP